MPEDAQLYHVVMEWVAPPRAVIHQWHGPAWDALEAVRLAIQSVQGVIGPAGAVGGSLIIRVQFDEA